MRIDENGEFLGRNNWWNKAGFIAKEVNKVSEEALDVDALSKSADKNVKKLALFYEKYCQLQEQENALDFSMIQKEFLDLLEHNPEVLKKLQERFQYFMIDEYQDTNAIQERILLKLLNSRQNICVVGDDDQGLYRFRGATIRNILEFEKNFPGKCKRIELTQNYRSHSGIIDFYNRWMASQKWNGENGKKYRFEKQVVPGRDVSKEGKYPSVLKVSAAGTDNWKNNVLNFLNDIKRKGILQDWNQSVFLFQSVQNDKAVELAHLLEDNGINVYSPRSSMFFERQEIKLAIGALCTLYKDYYVPPEFHAEFSIYLESCIAYFKDVLKKDKDLIVFVRQALNRHSFAENASLDYAFSGLFYQLLQFKDFAKHIQAEMGSENITDERPARNLAIFSRLLTKFEYLEKVNVFTASNISGTIKKFLTSYLAFLYEGGIEEYEDEMEYAPRGCVSFMTIHQSKGLEFPIVFVCSLWNTPRKQYTPLDETLQKGFYNKPPFEPIEQTKNFDFMRLYYTAFSRAQNILCLSCPEQGHGVPSRYFSEIYNPLPAWQYLKKEEWQEIVLDKIKPSSLKNSYSFTSHIILYENCPMQYKFFKELEFAPVRQGAILYGTLIHQTIEDIHKAVIQGNKGTVTKERVADWFNTNYENIKKKEHSYLSESARERALLQVMNYVHREEEHWDRIQESEVDVSLVEKDFILHGKIDLIRNENGRLDIIDFKSEKKPDINSEEGRERLAKYKRQLEIYAHIVEKRYGEQVENMRLYYTQAKEDENPYINFPKHSLVIDETIKQVCDVVHKIESRDYKMKERRRSQCKDCDMRHYCDRYWCAE